MALCLLTVFSQCAVCLKAKWEECVAFLFLAAVCAFTQPLLRLEDELPENNVRKRPKPSFCVGAQPNGKTHVRKEGICVNFQR